ncbi:MAG: ATP-binding cassette domain-containing protein, partial [Clostridia bacterium]|nr:ATP-binding cassette domain-containing protein [Clostridia bacterium]
PIGGKISFGEGLKSKDIGYLPQQTSVQKDFPASVLEVVLSGCQNKNGFHPFYNRAQKQLAMENIEKMGLTDITKHCYRELSGGQQQRVLLARALCAAKKILLLDEPVSGLDPKVTAQMYSLIDELNKKDGITIIMISHDILSAAEYADHILHIGKTVFFGTKSEYINSDVALGFTKAGEA